MQNPFDPSRYTTTNPHTKKVSSAPHQGGKVAQNSPVVSSMVVSGAAGRVQSGSRNM